MGFFLHIEVDSTLPPKEFYERYVVPIQEVLTKENLGRVLEGDLGDDVPGEKYALALEVVDQHRAYKVVEAILKSIEG